jgi:hypothetical protein
MHNLIIMSLFSAYIQNFQSPFFVLIISLPVVTETFTDDWVAPVPLNILIRIEVLVVYS